MFVNLVSFSYNEVEYRSDRHSVSVLPTSEDYWNIILGTWLCNIYYGRTAIVARPGHMCYYYCCLFEIFSVSRRTFNQRLCKCAVDVEYQ